MKKLATIIAALGTTGCVSYYDPTPRADKPGSVVQTATLVDSSKREGGTRVQLFYVSKIEGKEIENALNATSKSNYGKGMAVQPVTPKRVVFANRMISLEICAQTYNGAPILDLFRSDTKKCETLTRSFEANSTYYVTGEIHEKVATIEIVEKAPSGEDGSTTWDGKY